MAFKKRKMLRLQIFFFYKLLMWWVVIGKLKSDISGRSRCKPIRIYYPSSKNVVESFEAIALLVKESMILLRGVKCNFIE